MQCHLQILDCLLIALVFLAANTKETCEQAAWLRLPKLLQFLVDVTGIESLLDITIVFAVIAPPAISVSGNDVAGR